MKKILLLGDVIQDFNLMEYPPVPSHNYQALPRTTQIKAAGGVRYLRDIIKKILPVKDYGIQCPGDARGEKAVKVFNAWKPFPKALNDKEKQKDMVWRIDRIIGRAEPDGSVNDMVKNDIDKAGQANFLVIENLGLGWMESFLFQEESLGMELLQKANPDQIILKLSSLSKGLPFAKIRSCLDKMTVVIAAHTLRERGAAISEGLSWDRTIEDIVHEFDSGLSSYDLADCRRVVVLFSAEGAAIFNREAEESKVCLEKFLYHPSQYEGSIKANHPGQMSGHLSLATAAVIRSLELDEQYPFFVALSLALTAIRRQQEQGIKEDDKNKDPKRRFNFNNHMKTLCDILTVTDCLSARAVSTDRKKGRDEKERIEKQKELLAEYLKSFSCAFRHDLLENPPDDKDKEDTAESGKVQKMPFESRLLGDFTGYKYEYVASKAFQIVMQGTKKALSNVPIASYKSFLTADREEIERINAIKKLIIAYKNNPQDKRPLSLAVFGPPGSGKSFSIKQLADDLGFNDKSIRTFNLSEFKDPSELLVAFHIIRDATIQGNIPLIFWDEFDTNDLKWLKEFLAPMQDYEFRAGSVTHPLGKAIFVFAGGVFSSFEEFEKRTIKEDKKAYRSEKDGIQPAGENTDNKNDKAQEPYEGKKAPDFISRLRGYVNIKGPNPQEGGDKNYEYLIRRAILLRSVLERTYKQLVDVNGQIAIGASVAQAFLRVKKYKHGARSLESIVTMSNIVKAPFFGEAALPPDHLLNLHVDAAEFRKIMSKETMEMPMMEMIAEACHTDWKEQKDRDGYKYGPVRSDMPPKCHPLLVEYRKLDEKDKEGNRLTARLTQGKLDDIGLEIERQKKNSDTPGIELLDKNKDSLTRIEHDIWMRDHLLQGYDYSEKTVDALRLHRCVQRFDKLSEEDKKLDEAIVNSLRRALVDNKYGVVKAKS